MTDTQKHLATLRRWADRRDGGLGSAIAWVLDELTACQLERDRWKKRADELFFAENKS